MTRLHDDTHEAALWAFALGADDAPAPSSRGQLDAAQMRERLRSCPACFELACALLREQAIRRLELALADALAEPLAEPGAGPGADERAASGASVLSMPVRRVPRALAGGLLAAGVLAGVAALWATRTDVAGRSPAGGRPPGAGGDAGPATPPTLVARPERGAPSCRDPVSRAALTLRSPDRVLDAHRGPVEVLQFAPDGRLLTGSADGVVRIFDADGALKASLAAGGTLLDLAVSPAGPVLTLSDDGPAGRLWAADGRLRATLPDIADDAATKPFRRGRFSADGSRFLTYGGSNDVQVWRSDGTPLHTLSGHTQPLGWADFSPDGRQVATAARDGRAGVFDVASGAVVWLAGHREWVRYAGFSADGRTLATCDGEGWMRWFEPTGRRLAEVLAADVGLDRCRHSADGAALLVVDGRGRALRGPSAPPADATWRGEPVAPAGPYTVSFDTRDGRRATTVQEGACTLLWRDGRAETALDTPPGDVVFSADGATVAVGGRDGRVRLWRLSP